MRAGTSSVRTTNASTSTPIAAPTPICLMKTTPDVTELYDQVDVGTPVYIL